MSLLGKENLHRMSHQMRSYLGTLKRHKVVHQGYEWRYLEGGDKENQETILFVHGLAGSKTQWRSLMQIFSDRYHVIALDMPGLYNGLQTSSGQYDFQALANELAQFIELVALEKFHLFSHSLGASVSAVYAGQYPEKLLSLVLGSVVAVDNEAGTSGLSRLSEFREMMMFNTVDEFNELGNKLFYEPPQAPTILLRYSMNQLLKYRESHATLLSALDRSARLVRDSLTKISCPCMVINGEQDVFLTDSSTELIGERIQNVRIVRLERCAHIPHLEKPRALGLHYDEFLKTLKGGLTPEDRVA